MSDNDDTTEVQSTTEVPKPAAPKPAADAELPDWARQQISSANQEAANFRVQLKEERAAKKSLADQVSSLTAEKSAVSSSLSAVQSDFDRLATAIKAEVPNDHVFAFAKTLQGSTEDELSAHAAELKSMFGIKPGSSPAVDRSQGKGTGPGKSSPGDDFVAFMNSHLN